MADGAGEGARYRAFISYSHVDKAFGRRLHRQLERYAVPRRLVGRLTVNGPAPARVAPVFRDRDELPAAEDLTAEVRAALAASGALVVVCSPAAAASPWVAREIELFRGLHPSRPVLAALIAGDPATAFPPALWRMGGAVVEPLAADFRREGDGPRLALLKLVAGVLGLGLDELVQRDAQRGVRRVTAVTAGALGLAVAMSGLTTYALLQRAEAQRQRGEAEALVEFMLTDLRDRLKGVGRLDVLTAVNERALGYYEGQDIGRLSPRSLERRARLLHAMGEDDLSRGELESASRELQEAERSTAAMLREAPDDPDRIWAHAQSRFWSGYVAFQRDDRSDASVAWNDYLNLARRLAQVDPENAVYLREVGFAEGNLCTLALAEPPSPARAIATCRASLVWVEAAARRSPGLKGVTRDLANRHGWLSQAYRAAGDLAAATRERELEQDLLEPLIRSDPRDMDLRGQWVAMQRAMIGLENQRGQRAAARARIREVQVVLDEMIAFEPSNQRWRKIKERLSKTIELMKEN